jgi:bacterioferritin-associated ferredoxin
MGTAHAEIGTIQQAVNAGKTKGADMSMTVSGNDVCGFCKGDIAAVAEKAELKSFTRSHAPAWECISGHCQYLASLPYLLYAFPRRSVGTR